MLFEIIFITILLNVRSIDSVFIGIYKLLTNIGAIFLITITIIFEKKTRIRDIVESIYIPIFVC